MSPLLPAGTTVTATSPSLSALLLRSSPSLPPSLLLKAAAKKSKSKDQITLSAWTSNGRDRNGYTDWGIFPLRWCVVCQNQHMSELGLWARLCGFCAVSDHYRKGNGYTGFAFPLWPGLNRSAVASWRRFNRHRLRPLKARRADARAVGQVRILNKI